MTPVASREGPTELPRLRVAYIDHVAQLSGGEIALMRLIDTLDDVDAHVILAENGPLVARLSAAGVSVEVLPMRERTRDLRKDRVRPAGLPLTALLDTATVRVPPRAPPSSDQARPRAHEHVEGGHLRLAGRASCQGAGRVARP